MSKKQYREDAAEAQRALDAIASTAHALKSRIDAMQCMAITARLDLMDSNGHHDRNRTARTLQPIADELTSLIDDVAALLDAIRNASSGVHRGSRLQ